MDGGISQKEGLILFLSVVIYTWYSFYSPSNNDHSEDSYNQDHSKIWLLLTLIVSGIAFLSIESMVHLHSCIRMG